MKKSELTSLLTAATLFLALGALSARAEDPTPADPDQSDRPLRGRLLERFDANGDGRLDDTEHATARATVDREMRDRLAGNPLFMQRADTDKDGTISDAEWADARGHFQRARADRMERRPWGEQRRPGNFAQPHRPGSGARMHAHQDPGFQRGYLLGKYDADANGRLDETERAALRADRENRARQRMEHQLARLKTVDADGDGRISDAEWAAAKETFQARRQAGPMKRGPRGPVPPPAG
jgi:hypothetical protein